VKPRRLIGLGLFTRFGLGQMSAWLMLRGECPNASTMSALSTFGPVMSLFGGLWLIHRFVQRNHTLMTTIELSQQRRMGISIGVNRRFTN
jgi:hypothetical protein